MKRCIYPAAFALILGLAACTEAESDKPAPPAKPPASAPAKPAPKAPEPKPAEPVEKPAPAPPTDNCGLDPADMDYKTKVQCGLAEPAPVEEPQTPAESGYDPEGGYEFDDRGCPIGDPSPTPYCAGETDSSGEGELSFEEKCQQGLLTINDGCSSASTPYDDGPGSLYTNPEADPYKPLPEDTDPGYEEPSPWIRDQLCDAGETQYC